ncbi:MAG: DNA polymerase III PolC-type [bacterium ADurb.Bin157]|nr:MAG: DNA polymerase III PolC-type [bacterium ADurb.Bin157]
MKNIIPEIMNRPIRDLSFVILDLETTGFKPSESGVTEIAIISLKNGKEECFETLIDPETVIPDEIVALTGIDNNMVIGKPKFRDILPMVEDLFKDSIFVSHNVPFDWSFFDYHYKKSLQKSLKMPSLCTLRLARKFLSLKSNKLEEVAKYFQVPLIGAHRAMSDTKAVRGILNCFFDILEDKNIYLGADLYKHNLIFPDYPPTR